jgi:serine phosphatase RsbU (regulator of sigma subunit)
MFTALPAIAVLAVLAAVLAVEHRGSAADDRREELRRITVDAAISTRRFIDDQFAILAAVASAPVVRTNRYAEARQYLIDVARTGRFSAGLGQIDRHGFNRISSTLPPGYPKIDISDRQYFRAAIQGRPSVSDVLLGRIRVGPIVVFAYPVMGPDGKPNGALAGSIALNRLSAGLLRLQYAPGAGVTILDSTDHVLVGEDPVRGLVEAPRWYPIDELRGAEDGVAEASDGKDDQLLGFAAVPGTKWVVVLRRAESDVLGAIDRALWAELAAVALLALVGVLLTLATGRRLDQLDRRREEALAEQRAIALQLQHSLLPDLIVPDGLAAYAGYVPAQGAMSVGGDWYDLVDLGDGCVALSMGDVAGHGLGAAATMGKLRSATRAEALRSSSPAEALTGLDRFASYLDGRPLATVAFAVLELATGELRYAVAGHPPPLLLRADGTTELLEGGRSPLLGVAPLVPRAEASATVRRGDTLVLYTDGLVERPDKPIDAGLAGLAARAHELPRDVAMLGEALLAAVAEPRRDDAAVLVIQLSSEAS